MSVDGAIVSIIVFFILGLVALIGWTFGYAAGIDYAMRKS